MQDTNSFKPGDKVKYKADHRDFAPCNNHNLDTIYTVKRFEGDITFFEEAFYGCYFYRLELNVESKINIAEMKKESLQKIKSLIDSELRRFTDLSLNAVLTISESNCSNNNIILLDISA
jgi:hypothetical protein